MNEHILEHPIARYDSHYATQSRDYTLNTILKEIRRGSGTVISAEGTAALAGGNTLRHATEFARLLLAKGNKAAYDMVKQGLPAFAVQGRSSNNSRQIDVLSGYVILEYDDIDSAYAMSIASQNPYVHAAFVSMSETGIKIIGRATPIPDAQTYKTAWYSFALMFEEIGDPDPTGMHTNQLNVLTYDPNIYVNSNALNFTYDAIDAAEIDEAFPKSETAWQVLDTLPPEYQVAIENMEWKDGGKGRTRLPCFSGEHANDGWQSSSNAMEVIRQPDGSLKFRCFKCDLREVVSSSSDTAEIHNKQGSTYIPYQSTQADIDALIAKAPPIEVREGPSFRHFSTEERTIVRDVLQTSPDAGWHGSIPIWTPKYEHLHPLTNKFALNGQPSEVEKRRVWSTLFGSCEQCGGTTAKWIDRYLLTAGYYCDGCHTDYPLGSYLEIELNRKLPNSIVSDYQGFLGDNPDFEDFRLFQNGVLTHLGAGMGVGKTTEIIKFLVMIAAQGLGRGILVVPRIALAQQLIYRLRRDYGHDAWGLWTEGSSKHNKFIGDYGAVVCLPSLPQVAREAEDMGIGAEQLYIAVDEIDFSYELFSVEVTQTNSAKKILRDALKTTGLVVAGQTESTLSLEAFAAEMECEEIQGFYATAAPAEGHVTLKEHAIDTNINAFLGSGIEDISEQLANDQNVYSFCTSRRDCEILADRFSIENPVVYNAYTRGEYRNHELLRYGKLTDSRLFLGTAAAGVGISFLDKKAVTVIMNGLIYGSRHANMAAQESIRDRGRRNLILHYKPYNFSLPVRPTEQRQVSIYHETLKQITETATDVHLPTHAITKIAAAQALASLADIQFAAFIRYHLSVVGNMGIVEATPTPQSEESADTIKAQRAEIRLIENELKKENAKAILNTVLDTEKDTELLTSSEIRKQRNQGRLTTDATLAHELANAAAQAVGWDDVVDRFQKESVRPFEKPPDPFYGIFNAEDIEIALALVERNFNFDAWRKKREGYLAVNNPKWTAHRFEAEVSQTDTQLVMDGFGIELTAVKDPRLLGECLGKLIDALQGQVFDSQTLVDAVNSVLSTEASTQKTYGQELRSGGLGASEYRKARFLHCAEDPAILVDWLAQFISEWYPARLSKREDYYAVQPDKHAELYLKSFERWLKHQNNVPDVAEIKLQIFAPVEMPESNAEQKEIARERRANGETLKAIAKDLDVSPKSVSLWCKGITPKKQTKQTRADRQKSRINRKAANTEKQQEQINEAYRLHTQEGLSYRQIAERMGVKSPRTIGYWLEKFKF